jgi:cytidine deaminase
VRDSRPTPEEIVSATTNRGTVKFALSEAEGSMSTDTEMLFRVARAARLHAYAPFSKFKVGAALETTEGVVVTGCNVENATYGLTVCAERVALFKALSEGHRRFRRIAVVADTAEPTPPCGACRQLLWEFGGDLEVLLGNLGEHKATFHLRDLLPHPFDVHFLTPQPEHPSSPDGE